MSEVTQYESRYRAVDMASPVLSTLAKNATVAGDAIRGVQTIIGVAFSAYARVSGFVNQIISIQSAFEGLKLNITGTLRAYSLVGESMQQIARTTINSPEEFARRSQVAFQQAEQVATSTLRRIEEQAARLPGTAEDYLQVFQDTLGVASRSHFMARRPGNAREGDTTGTGIQGFSDFVSQYTATAIANRIDAPQAGRDLMLMLQGMAGMDVRTWRMLQPLIHKTERDTRNVTAQEFNRWSGQQRSRAIERALALYRPLLDQIGDTWEAQVGTFSSIRRTLIRDTTQPIFQVLTSGLGMLNQELTSVSGGLTALGQVLSSQVAVGMKAAVNHARDLYGWLRRAGEDALSSRWLATIVGGGATLGRTAYHTVARATGTNEGRLGALAMVGGPTMGAVASFLQHTDAVADTMRSLYSTILPLAHVLRDVHSVYSSIATFGGEILARAVPMVARFAAGVVSAGAQITEVIGEEVGKVLTSMVPVASIALSVFGAALNYVSGEISGAIPYVTGTIRTAGSVLVELAGTVVALKNDIASIIGPLQDFRGGLDAIKAYTDMLNPSTASNRARGWIADQLGIETSAGTVARGVVAAVGTTLANTTTSANQWLAYLWDAGDAGYESQSGRRASRTHLTEAELNQAFAANEEMVHRLVGYGGYAQNVARPGVQNPEAEGHRIVNDFVRTVNTYIMNAAIEAKVARNAAGTSTTPPNQRPPGAYNDFRYSRFDITQRFAEGFDPDRIAAVFASDLEAMAEQRLSSGFQPV